MIAISGLLSKIWKGHLSAPIPPLKSVDGWKDISIKECGEPLVPLGSFSKYPQIFTDGIYWGERSTAPYEQDELKSALITPFVRKGVAEKLLKAASYLPEGHALMVWDSYRPLATQQGLYDDFHQQLMDKKDLPSEEASEAAQQFVSIPSTDLTRPPPHNTGGAVDLTIVRFDEEVWEELKELERIVLDEERKKKDWKPAYAAEMHRMQLLREHSTPLNMGTAFDEVADRTATRYYEEKLESSKPLTAEETEALMNRRLLFNVMKEADLSNYQEEWWHFDFGNQFDAIRTGKTATYGAAEFSLKCETHEQMRRDHYLGTQRLQLPEETTLSGKMKSPYHYTAKYGKKICPEKR